MSSDATVASPAESNGSTEAMETSPPAATAPRDASLGSGGESLMDTDGAGRLLFCLKDVAHSIVNLIHSCNVASLCIQTSSALDEFNGAVNVRTFRRKCQRWNTSLYIS